ncbi:hypothetical protein TNCV_1321781 [Trichonephila clavipes]|nr:hypothetical protein TNCV_1321781 [Trichonephila clavipes]
MLRGRCRGSKSSRWWGVEVWRRGCRLRCPPRHMIMAQNMRFVANGPLSSKHLSSFLKTQLVHNFSSFKRLLIFVTNCLAEESARSDSMR